MIPGVISGGFTSVASVITDSSDRYYNNVVALLHFDGANNSNKFFDDAFSPHPYTPNNAELTTAENKFGSASGAFPVASSRTLTAPSSSDWDFGSGDFTIEGWIKKISNTAAYEGIVCRDSIGGTRGWLVFKDYPSHKLGFGCYSGATNYELLDSDAMPVGQWIHVAVTRRGDTLRLFRDGTVVATLATLGNAAINSSGTPLCFGDLYATAGPNPATYMDGYLDDWRITKGVARWTANFVPPSSAAASKGSDRVADPLFSKVLALLHMDSADTGTYFTDSSSYKRAVSATSVVASANSPRFGTASAFFDGSTDVLTMPDSTDWEFGTDDFTVEMWIKPANVTGIKHLIGRYNAPGGVTLQQRNAKLHLLASTGGSWNLDAPASVDSLKADVWSHVALQREAGVFTLFCDGVIVLTNSSLTGSLGSATGNPMCIGNNLPFADQPFAGYIDEVRVTRGVGAIRYAAAFPDATPGTSFSDYGPAALDMRFEGTEGSTTIIDSSANAIAFTNTGVAIRTGTKSEGVSSGQFAGSQYLTAPTAVSQIDFGSEDFSIEVDFQPTTVSSGIRMIATNRATSGSDPGFLLWQDTNSVRFICWGPSAGTEMVNLHATGLLVTSIWSRIRVHRRGNLFELLHNNVVVAQATSSSAIAASGNAFRIGIDPSTAGRELIGYLDRLVIHKGGTTPVVSQAWWYGQTHSDLTIDDSTNLITRGAAAATYRASRARTPISGKRYWEIEIIDDGGVPATYGIFGMAGASVSLNTNIGMDGLSYGYASAEGALYNNASQIIVPGNLPTAVKGDVIGFALDTATGKFWISKNGTWMQSGNPAAGTGQQATASTSSLYFPATSLYTPGSKHRARFNRTFYAPPAGFSTFEPAPVTDPLYGNVSLLLHADGANAATNLYDFSKYAHKPVLRGDAKMSTAQKKFGPSSLIYDAAGDHCEIPWDASLHPTGDFTLELWYFPVATIAPWGVLVNMGGGIGIAYPSYSITGDGSDGNGYINFSGSSNNSAVTIGSETGATGRIGAPTTGQWNHIAVTRSGNTWKGFLNGVEGFSFTDSDNPYNSTPRGLQIGGRFDSSWGTVGSGTSINGYIDEVRFTNGVSRYNAAFTPPAAPGADRG